MARKKKTITTSKINKYYTVNDSHKGAHQKLTSAVSWLTIQFALVGLPFYS